MRFNLQKTRAFLKTPLMKDMLLAYAFLIMGLLLPADFRTDDGYYGMIAGICFGIAFALAITTAKRGKEQDTASTHSPVPPAY